LFEKIPIEHMVRMAMQPDNAPSASYQRELFG
jgi:hypothetical protein